MLNVIKMGAPIISLKAILAFFILISPLIRNAAGFIPYAFLISLISIGLFSYYVNSRLRFNVLVWFILIIMMFMFIFSIVKSMDRVVGIYAVAPSALLLISANFIVFQKKTLVLNVSFGVLCIFYVFFVVSGAFHGYRPSDINDYFLTSSHNVVSANAIFFQIMYSVAYYRVHKKLPRFTPFITFILAFISFGRSGVALSGALLLLSYFHIISSLGVVKKSLMIISLMIIIFSGYHFYSELSGFITDTTKFSKGLDTPRTIINKEYFELLDIEAVIVGADMYKVALIADYQNPHNSLILGHYKFGFTYIIFLLFFMLISFYWFVFYRETLVYSFMLLVFLVRCYFDVLSLLGVYDVVFYFVFLAIFYDRGRVRSIITFSRTPK